MGIQGEKEYDHGERNEKRKETWMLYVVQIFIGAEKQSGIRSERYGTSAEDAERDEEAEI